MQVFDGMPVAVRSDRPRVLMVKEHVDVFGPYRPVCFEGVTPRALLDLFPFKPTYWEMTTLLRSDWAIVHAETESGQRSYAESLAHLAPVIELQRGMAVRLRDLDLSKYDIVISFEACLSPLYQSFRAQNWFYFHHEHSNDWYNRSRSKPARGYTAFLDHMCGSTGVVSENYPQSIDFPYLRDPQTVRTCFPSKSRSTGPVAWVDARTIMLHANGSALTTWTEACDRYLRRLETESGVRVITRGEIYRGYYNLSPTGDAVAYLEDMSCAGFYIGLAAAGAGQALCDAASLGLVCFGSPELVYHRMICPPERMCRSLSSALGSAADLYASPPRMRAAITEQDAILKREFQFRPIKRLFDRGRYQFCVV
jgi:hypothetical protein